MRDNIGCSRKTISWRSSAFNTLVSRPSESEAGAKSRDPGENRRAKRVPILLQDSCAGSRVLFRSLPLATFARDTRPLNAAAFLLEYGPPLLSPDYSP